MKHLLLVVSMICLVSGSAAQTLIRANSIGGRWLGSRIFATGTGSWIVMNSSGDGDQSRFMRLHDRWRLDTLTQNSLVPKMQFHTKSIMFNEQQGWIGERHGLAYTTDYENWTRVTIGETGREVTVSALGSYANGVGVLASLQSYVVTKADTDAIGNGSRWVSDSKNSVWLFTPITQKRLTSDTTILVHPLTNVEQIDSTSFAVGHSGSKNLIALLYDDGRVIHIPRPIGMESGSALCLRRTTSGDIYCFYSTADGGDHHIPPSAVVYHPSDGTTDYINLDRIGDVNYATSSDDLVVGAVNGGLVVIQGTSARRYAFSDTLTFEGVDYPHGADVYGVEFINRDTLLCNTQASIFVIPRSLLTATSSVQTEPGIIVVGTRNLLVNIVDGLAQTSWSIYDNVGRVHHTGTIALGERSLLLPLEGVSSGVYHLLLTPTGGEVRTVELLVTH